MPTMTAFANVKTAPLPEQAERLKKHQLYVPLCSGMDEDGVVSFSAIPCSGCGEQVRVAARNWQCAGCGTDLRTQSFGHAVAFAFACKVAHARNGWDSLPVWHQNILEAAGL